MSKLQILPDSTEPPTTGADLLASIDAERRAAHATLDGLPARERALLEQGAADAAFDALDKERRLAERQLARLDLRERGAIQQARKEHEGEQTAEWIEHRDAFRAKATELIAAARTALRVHAEMAVVFNRTKAAAGSNGSYLPHLYGLPLASQVDGYEQSVANLPDAVHIPAVGETHHTVEFLKPHAPYNAGEGGIFTAEQAWVLVDSGKARFAPGTKAPRRPVHRVHRPITPPAIHVTYLADGPGYKRGDVARLQARDAAYAIRQGTARRAELAEI